MNRIVLLGIAMILGLTGASAATDERVWEYDQEAKVIRYGIPETDDVLVTMRCGRKGRIQVEWMFSNRPVPRPKKAEAILYAEDKEFMEDMPIGGKLVKVTFGDEHVGWSLMEVCSASKWGRADR
jgi:hypothetical protein